jgi:hypothetical protein
VSDKPTVIERLFARVEKRPHGCWIWTGALNGAGYGAIGSGGKVLRTHRVAYEHLVGPIPDGLQLDHLCRVRSCCNPAHLEPVTNHENWLRGEHHVVKAIRDGVCKRGHDLTTGDVYVRRNGGILCRRCVLANNRAYRLRVIARLP